MFSITIIPGSDSIPGATISSEVGNGTTIGLELISSDIRIRAAGMSMRGVQQDIHSMNAFHSRPGEAYCGNISAKQLARHTAISSIRLLTAPSEEKFFIV